MSKKISRQTLFGLENVPVNFVQENNMSIFKNGREHARRFKKYVIIKNTGSKVMLVFYVQVFLKVAESKRGTLRKM